MIYCIHIFQIGGVEYVDIMPEREDVAVVEFRTTAQAEEAIEQACQQCSKIFFFVSVKLANIQRVMDYHPLILILG